jgi:hypothetical protein
MASEIAMEKGVATGEHKEIFPHDGGDTTVMGTTQLNDNPEDILLVPAPSSDPRGSHMHLGHYVVALY